MTSHRTTGRTVGALLLLQLAGLIVPFVLLHPLMRGSDDYLAHAAASAGQIRAAVLLLLANCALTIGITVAAWPVFRGHSERLAVALLAASICMFTQQAVDNAHALSMLSLSQQYARGGAPSELYAALAMVVGTTRGWVHYHELLLIDAWIFLFYLLLFHHALAPRPIAALGLLTVVLHFGGIPLQRLLGLPVIMPLGMPMALTHVITAAWLVWTGFPDAHPRPSTPVPSTGAATA